MKKLFILLCWLIALIHSPAETKSEAFMASKITRAKNMSDQDKIKYLMDFVVFESNYDIPRSQRELDLIQEAISEVIKTTGHAEFFAEEVRRKQKEVIHIPPLPMGNRNEYDVLRKRIIYKTLPLMPSPETIRVLGDFLHDDKDMPDGPIPGDYYANNGYAMLALKKIGLRNPAEKHPYDDSPTCLKKWIAWYEQIKAGEITFSFEGQPHEYRFNPDGTWVTIPLPQESDSNHHGAVKAVSGNHTFDQNHAQNHNNSWSPWVYAGVACLLMLITFTARKIWIRKAASAQP